MINFYLFSRSPNALTTFPWWKISFWLWKRLQIENMIRNRFNILAPWQPSARLPVWKQHWTATKSDFYLLLLSPLLSVFFLIASFMFMLSYISLVLCTFDSWIDCWKILFDAWIVIQNTIAVDGYTKIATCRAITSTKHLVNAFRFNGGKMLCEKEITAITSSFSFARFFCCFHSVSAILFLFELRYTLDGCSFSHPHTLIAWQMGISIVKQTMADRCWLAV